MASNEGDSILVFKYMNNWTRVYLDEPYVASNKVSVGAALRMEEYYIFNNIGTTRIVGGSNGNGFYHFSIYNGEFLTNLIEFASDDTDIGPRTSCIEFKGSNRSWAYIYISSTEMDNNQGVITNEIYVDETAAKLELN